MFNDPVAHCRGQQIDNRRVNFRWCGERPAFLPIARDNFCDLIGQLFLNPAMSLCFHLGSLCNRIGMPTARSIAHRKSPSEVAHLVNQSSVRIC